MTLVVDQPLHTFDLTHTNKRLDGKAVASVLLDNVRAQVAGIHDTTGSRPGLRVILVGNNPASQVYVKKKAEQASRLGLDGDILHLPEDVTMEHLLGKIDAYNADPDVHAILIQLPLPKHLDTNRVLARVAPSKDVDGFHPFNLGRLFSGDNPIALPCTPAGMMVLLNEYRIPIEGRHAVVVGRSTIVGKPMGQLLLQQNATVTYCHSRTADLAAETRQADILVVAIGHSGMITADMIKPGAIVLDVGINRTTDGRLVGDVADSPNVWDRVGGLTPVPGGVGPMTIAMLMQNTVSLFLAQQ